MKFVSAIIALVAALAVGSEAAMPKNKQEWRKELNLRMKNGQLDNATIMKKARPHSDAAKARKLDGLEITGEYSVQFQSCFSLTTSYEDMFEDNDNSMIMGMFSQGNIMALQSYAIFRLCYGGVCSSSGNQAMLEYVVDLSTYVQALVNYLPEQMEGFCEGCQNNYDSCMAILYGASASAYDNNQAYKYQSYSQNDNNYNGNSVNNVNYQNGQYGAYGNNGGYNNNQQQQQQTYNGGYQQQQTYNNGYNNNNNQAANDNGYNRKLADLHEFEQRVLKDGQVVKQLDCNLCLEYNCLVEDDNQENDMYGFEAASEWLSDIAQCAETGVAYSGGGYYQNQNQNGGGGDDAALYAGMICNGDGSGVEIGLFYDEDCLLYLPNEAYSNYMSYFDQTYQQMTKEIIEFTFSNAVFSCKEQEVTYTTQNLNGYNSQYNGNYNWNGDDDDVAEWCELLVEGGDSTPVDMATCGMYSSDNYQQGQYYNNVNYNYEERYDQYQDQDEQNQYMYTYDWYRYEITQDNSLDMQAVCKKAKKSSTSLHTFYNTNNGNLYSYSNSNSASDTITEFMEDTDSEVDFVSSYAWIAQASKLSGGAKFGIVAGTGVLVGAVVALFLRFRSSADDDKNISLMEDEELESKGEVA